MKAILEIIGAVVVTIVILGTPVLSFVSFINDWDGFIKLFFTTGLIVDCLYVLNILIHCLEEDM